MKGRPVKLDLLVKKPSFWLIIAVVLVGLGAGLVYKYTDIANRFKPTSSKTVMTQQETQDLINKVGKIMLLPQNETPTIATVADREKLSAQQFFTYAQNGDKVLIYQKARKAIIYRPGTNQIIEVGPVNIAPNQAATPTAEKVIKRYKMVIYNGTEVVGLTKKYDGVVSENVPNIDITDRDNAKKSDYDKSILVDLAGDKKVLSQTIADKLKLTLSGLPKGEMKPENADFLVILGKDFATPTPKK